MHALSTPDMNGPAARMTDVSFNAKMACISSFIVLSTGKFVGGKGWPQVGIWCIEPNNPWRFPRLTMGNTWTTPKADRSSAAITKTGISLVRAWAVTSGCTTRNDDIRAWENGRRKTFTFRSPDRRRPPGGAEGRPNKRGRLTIDHSLRYAGTCPTDGGKHSPFIAIEQAKGELLCRTDIT